MKLVLSSRSEISAWLWGINGITGVMATVLAVMIAMSWGISYSYWTGVAIYAIAGLSFIKIKKAVAPDSP
jgi:multidrug transporter EmrE-like cation transporter